MVNALVDMYMKCGDICAARWIFDECTDKNLVMYNTIMSNYVQDGWAGDVLVILDEMLQKGPRPDKVTMLSTIAACAQLDDLSVGESSHTYVLQNGLEAYKNVELAHYAAAKLTQLAPERVGIHVLLSNIYASAGKWTDVARVRLQMKKKGVQKVPGSSSIEVHGLIHEFTSGDESHTENTQIGLMLEEINCRLSEAGYVSDRTNVLLDVDEQEKEHLLRRHSAKLAMAYGLITTDQGIPIRVVKNLRMCSDCHSFAKLVSKLYDREITVRDNKRYHFFKEGFCACRDYW
ncbi:hypothetical protein JHK85_002749 [Glycine max]|nr:hypothetical protein JHK85_002749 [Glycine max]KAG5090070.1 hypothetical protein JHK86_002682 [Glycine max]